MRNPVRVLCSKITTNWTPLVVCAALLAALATALWFKLGTLTPGYSADEFMAFQNSDSLRHIYHHPVNAPFLLLVRGLMELYPHNLIVTRIAAASIGTLTLLLFYGLVRHWHGGRTAAWGTILFGLSAWFLHTSRLGVPDVLLFGLLALVTCYLWLRRAGSGWAVLTGFAAVAVFLYVPGIIWFVVLGILWQWKAVDRAFKKNLWAVTAGAVILIAALVPLGIAIYHNPTLVKTMAGIPLQGWPMPLDVAKNLAHVPINLFVSGPDAPERWLGHVAVLDAFTMAMFFLGGYLYIRHIGLQRVQLIIGIMTVGTILISLGGGVTLTLLMPFVYVVAASGVGFMIDRWLRVFPRNAIAQGVGYALIVLAVASAAWYSCMHYFAAWPQAKDSKAIFTVSATPPSGTIKK